LPTKDISYPVPQEPGFLFRSFKQTDMKQIFENYTDEDRLVWLTLFDRQIKNLKGKVSAAFLTSLQTVEFRRDTMPDFRRLDQILGARTGWSMEVVPTIIPQKQFFELLALKKFPATTWLRKMTELDYLEEPDMFHDVFGHVPLLSNESYTAFFIGMAKLALQHADNPLAIELIGKVYWFTIEFGLIREESVLKIYGAGIISSAGETLFSLSEKPQHLDFNVRDIMRSQFRTDVFQEKYYIIDSFEALYNSLPDIACVLEEELERVLPIKA
jgi:phenylalanine-4-hydroxylase